MGFTEAFLGLVLITVVLAVIIPITGELLPTMIGDMGPMTGMMVSSTIVVIIASAIFIFMRQSLEPSHAQMQGN